MLAAVVERFGQPYTMKQIPRPLSPDGLFSILPSRGRQVAPLPDGLSATQAAPLMCVGLTIWAALHHERVKSAGRVGIIGAGGGLGHLGVQFAAHLGKEVLAIDANDQSLELVRRIKTGLGLVQSRIHIADARITDMDDMRLIGQDSSGAPSTELGLDAVILLPEPQRAFDMGMKLLRNHGTMVVVSFPQEKLAVSAHDLVFRDISVVGSLVGRNHQLREMLNFAMLHRVSAEIKTFPFGQLNELVQKSHQGVGGKMVIDMTL
ncbi:hypothetical protein QQX98_004358 [Neonectria punicea]|uniref:Alcohol dehydrogenase-like C-terminal domain-containing protein n=1 Tax=Neonectria punicea TaxID=979145 RepID=A0ABR1H997_9HYPO